MEKMIIDFNNECDYGDIGYRENDLNREIDKIYDSHGNEIVEYSVTVKCEPSSYHGNLSCRRYYKNCMLHRKDRPAVEYDDGGKEWWINGKRHNRNGPAIERNLDTNIWIIEWWVNGKRHRKDGPAIDRSYTKEWYINGKLHRKDGPAIDSALDRQWWINGKLHREDGPAVEKHTNNTVWNKQWYYNGELIGDSYSGFTQEDFERYLRSLNIKEYW